MLLAPAAAPTTSFLFDLSEDCLCVVAPARLARLNSRGAGIVPQSVGAGNGKRDTGRGLLRSGAGAVRCGRQAGQVQKIRCQWTTSGKSVVTLGCGCPARPSLFGHVAQRPQSRLAHTQLNPLTKNNESCKGSSVEGAASGVASHVFGSRDLCIRRHRTRCCRCAKPDHLAASATRWMSAVCHTQQAANAFGPTASGRGSPRESLQVSRAACRCFGRPF
jgi:hypothetical protein